MARPKKIRSEGEVAPPKTLAFRTSDEFAEWVEALAKHNRSTVATLIEQSLVKFAKDAGFTKQPPLR